MNDNRTSPFSGNRNQLFTAFFFAFVLLLGYQLVRLLLPFSSALIWAAVLAIALYPVHRRLTALLGNRSAISAGAMTLAAVLLVIGPAVSLLIVLASQATDLYHWASDPSRTDATFKAWSDLTKPFLDAVRAIPFFANVDIEASLINSVHGIASDMAANIGATLKNIAFFILNILIMLISLYFFFRNGGSYLHEVLDLLPLPVDHKSSIARRLHETFTAVIHGIVLIALLQGAMTGIGFAIFGVPFSVLWGALAAMLALLPIGGAALVWVPGAVYLFLSGQTISAVLLAVWGTVLVSLPDNFLKPLIIGRKTGISSFFLFLAILGGLQAYGILGLLFGPLLVAAVSAFIGIYREEYADRRHARREQSH